MTNGLRLLVFTSDTGSDPTAGLRILVLRRSLSATLFLTLDTPVQ